MTTVTRPGQILGGLPIMATVSFGYDSFHMEHWAEVEKICWLRRDGTAGKEIPQKVWDRAEKYDCYFCNLIENINEQMAYEATEEKEGIK